MKLPESGACQWAPVDGNLKTLTALGENRADRFSDASSTLAASTNKETSFVYQGKRGFFVAFAL